MSSDFITAVLCEWVRPEQLAAVAHVLRAALLRMSAEYCATGFADTVRLPANFVDVTDPPLLSIEGCLAELIAAPPSDAVMRRVRALFLLLFMFDGRVRRLVMVQHEGLAQWHVRPPDRTRAFRFVAVPAEHAPPDVQRDCLAGACHAFIADVMLIGTTPGPRGPAPSSQRYEAVVRAFVDECRRRWLYGYNVPPPLAYLMNGHHDDTTSL